MNPDTSVADSWDNLSPHQQEVEPWDESEDIPNTVFGAPILNSIPAPTPSGGEVNVSPDHPDSEQSFNTYMQANPSQAPQEATTPSRNGVVGEVENAVDGGLGMIEGFSPMGMASAASTANSGVDINDFYLTSSDSGASKGLGPVSMTGFAPSTFSAQVMTGTPDDPIVQVTGPKTATPDDPIEANLNALGEKDAFEGGDWVGSRYYPQDIFGNYIDSRTGQTVDINSLKAQADQVDQATQGFNPSALVTTLPRMVDWNYSTGQQQSAVLTPDEPVYPNGDLNSFLAGIPVVTSGGQALSDIRWNPSLNEFQDYYLPGVEAAGDVEGGIGSGYLWSQGTNYITPQWTFITGQATANPAIATTSGQFIQDAGSQVLPGSLPSATSFTTPVVSALSPQSTSSTPSAPATPSGFDRFSNLLGLGATDVSLPLGMGGGLGNDILGAITGAASGALNDLEGAYNDWADWWSPQGPLPSRGNVTADTGLSIPPIAMTPYTSGAGISTPGPQTRIFWDNQSVPANMVLLGGQENANKPETGDISDMLNGNDREVFVHPFIGTQDEGNPNGGGLLGSLSNMILGGLQGLNLMFTTGKGDSSMVLGPQPQFQRTNSSGNTFTVGDAGTVTGRETGADTSNLLLNLAGLTMGGPAESWATGTGSASDIMPGFGKLLGVDLTPSSGVEPALTAGGGSTVRSMTLGSLGGGYNPSDPALVQSIKGYNVPGNLVVEDTMVYPKSFGDAQPQYGLSGKALDMQNENAGAYKSSNTLWMTDQQYENYLAQGGTGIKTQPMTLGEYEKMYGPMMKDPYGVLDYGQVPDVTDFFTQGAGSGGRATTPYVPEGTPSAPLSANDANLLQAFMNAKGMGNILNVQAASPTVPGMTSAEPDLSGLLDDTGKSTGGSGSTGVGDLVTQWENAVRGLANTPGVEPDVQGLNLGSTPLLFPQQQSSMFTFPAFSIGPSTSTIKPDTGLGDEFSSLGDSVGKSTTTVVATSLEDEFSMPSSMFSAPVLTGLDGGSSSSPESGLTSPWSGPDTGPTSGPSSFGDSWTFPIFTPTPDVGGETGSVSIPNVDVSTPSLTGSNGTGPDDTEEPAPTIPGVPLIIPGLPSVGGAGPSNPYLYKYNVYKNPIWSFAPFSGSMGDFDVGGLGLGSSSGLFDDLGDFSSCAVNAGMSPGGSFFDGSMDDMSTGPSENFLTEDEDDYLPGQGYINPREISMDETAPVYYPDLRELLLGARSAYRTLRPVRQRPEPDIPIEISLDDLPLEVPDMPEHAREPRSLDLDAYGEEYVYYPAPKELLGDAKAAYRRIRGRGYNSGPREIDLDDEYGRGKNPFGGKMKINETARKLAVQPGLHRQFFTKLANGMEVDKVDGAYIRNNITEDYLLGSNPYADPALVPKGHIYVSDTNDPKDTFGIIVHEGSESGAMKNGFKYRQAHEHYGNVGEQIFRQSVGPRASEKTMWSTANRIIADQTIRAKNAANYSKLLNNNIGSGFNFNMNRNTFEAYKKLMMNGAMYGGYDFSDYRLSGLGVGNTGFGDIGFKLQPMKPMKQMKPMKSVKNAFNIGVGAINSGVNFDFGASAMKGFNLKKGWRW
jgi:hypothetical protein